MVRCYLGDKEHSYIPAIREKMRLYKIPEVLFRVRVETLARENKTPKACYYKERKEEVAEVTGVV